MATKGQVPVKTKGRQRIESKLPFTLYMDEKLIIVIKPHKSKYILKKLFPLYGLMAVLMIAILISATFGFAPNITIPIYALMLIGLTSFSVLATLLVVIVIYPRLTFWVTNKRIINGSGVIKYVIRSIPIEVITDIVIQRALGDFFFGTNEIFLPTINDKIYQLYPNKDWVNHIPSVDAPMTKALQTALADLRAKRMAKRTEMSQVSP